MDARVKRGKRRELTTLMWSSLKVDLVCWMCGWIWLEIGMEYQGVGVWDESVVWSGGALI